MLRTVLIGAVEGSKVALDALIEAGLPPALVLTLPPDAADRHSDFVDLATPARNAGSDVLFTKSINDDETLESLAAAAPDLCLVLGWSQICGGDFRAVAKIGNIGFHPAPLPRLRGRAVIPWTILIGAESTGSSLFWLDDGVDSGPILMQKSFPVAADETARTLYEKHTRALGEMIPEAVRQVEAGTAAKTPQDHSLATYCAKRTPADGLIDWHAPAEDVWRFVRAVGDPYPGAFALTSKGTKLIVDRARLLPHSERYIGLAGQIQCHTEDGFGVRCGDGVCIEVLEWRWPRARRPKLHGKLRGVGDS